MFETVQAPLDGRWWDAVAGHALDLASGSGMPGADLRALTILVPRSSDAPWLRGALHARLGGGVWIAPRIVTLERWVGPAPGPPARRLVELYEALRASAWAREAFGERPGALWALAGDLAELGDELTLAAVGEEARFEGRLRASVQRHFQRRAARAGSAQAQLVLGLWQAHCGTQFGAGALLRQWAQRLDQCAGPLLLTAPFGLEPWQRSTLAARLGGARVRVVTGEALEAARAQPWLALAWPELFDAPDAQELPRAPLAQRGLAARAVAPPALRILAAASLEEEAGATAALVLDWLDAGLRRIGLIALDRLAARRVRALLERAQVVVADQSGWKLSTTSAAATVMRWLDLVTLDFRTRDLLDWLRSPFALDGAPGRLALARRIDEVTRTHALSGGLKALTRVLAAPAAASSAPQPDAAHAALARLAASAQRLRAASAPGRLAAALGATLDELGMRGALARDPVGRDVLREIEALGTHLAGSAARLTLAEFRELMARRFEAVNATDPGADSPVLMLSLAGACLRPFDAAVLIGVDAQHLPSGAEPGVLMASAVRRDLGLPTAADAHRRQAGQLAALLATVPRVVATWRQFQGDEPRALSPWLDRLIELAQRAGWPALVQGARLAAHEVVPRPSACPAPGARGRLPARVSAGAYQSLVDCPYQFFARHLLGLRRREAPAEGADKRDLGVALHAILHELHRDHEAGALQRLPDAGLEELLAAITSKQFGRELRERPSLIAYRRRILDLVPAYVRWLRERAGQGWHAHAVEFDLRVPLRLAEGRSVDLTGRVDRIDAGEDGSHEVIDYKARAHEALRRAAADPGEQVQLAFYAVALGAPVRRASYLGFDRAAEAARKPGAAVRQIGAAEPFGQWVQMVGQRLQADLARIDQGAALPALGVESSCAVCEMRGLCRRAEWAGRAP